METRINAVSMMLDADRRVKPGLNPMGKTSKGGVPWTGSNKPCLARDPGICDLSGHVQDINGMVTHTYIIL